MSVHTTEPFVDSPTKPPNLERRKSPMSPSESSATSWENTATNSDVSSVDLEALCKRLNEYNSRNEVAWALLRQQQRSVSSKQAHDVAAAARFRLRLDQTGPDGVEEPVSPKMRIRTEYPHKLRRSLSTETVSSLAGSRLTRTKDSQSVLRKRKVTRPPPLRLESLTAEPQEIQSAALPVRTSSKHAMRDYFRHAEEIPLQRRATIAGTEHDIQRPIAKFPPRTASRAVITIPTLQAPLNVIMTAGTNRPSTAPSSPTEDQLRREIERSLLESKDKTRAEQRRSRKLAQLLPAEIRNELTRTATITAATTKSTPIVPPELQTPGAITRIGTAPSIPVLPLTPTSTIATPSNNPPETNTPPEIPAPIPNSDIPPMRRTPSPPLVELTPDVSPTDTSAASSKSSLRRKKSLFGWLQKRTEVDELIELYMNDEQLDEEPKRRPSKARLGIFRSKSNGQMDGSEENREVL